MITHLANETGGPLFEGCELIMIFITSYILVLMAF